MRKAGLVQLENVFLPKYMKQVLKIYSKKFFFREKTLMIGPLEFSIILKSVLVEYTSKSSSYE